jgi:hypothetical protein
VTNYYVYYRVDPARLEVLGVLVQELIRIIEKDTGIRGRWMRRRDGSATYMEVYEGVQDESAFEAVLDRESVKLGLERKTERFVCA